MSDSVYTFQRVCESLRITKKNLRTLGFVLVCLVALVTGLPMAVIFVYQVSVSILLPGFAIFVAWKLLVFLVLHPSFIPHVKYNDFHTAPGDAKEEVLQFNVISILLMLLPAWLLNNMFVEPLIPPSPYVYWVLLATCVVIAILLAWPSRLVILGIATVGKYIPEGRKEKDEEESVSQDEEGDDSVSEPTKRKRVLIEI